MPYKCVLHRLYQGEYICSLFGTGPSQLRITMSVTSVCSINTGTTNILLKGYSRLIHIPATSPSHQVLPSTILHACSTNVFFLQQPFTRTLFTAYKRLIRIPVATSILLAPRQSRSHNLDKSALTTACTSPPATSPASGSAPRRRPPGNSLSHRAL